METIALTRKFVVAVGLGLVLSSLELNVVRSGFDFQYGNDGTTKIFVIALVVLGAALLVANVLLEGDRFLATASGVGATLLGFFSFVPLTLGLGHLGDLDLGSWFALGGSALIVLGAAPFGALAAWKREPARPGWPVCASWLAGILGLALVMVSLPRPLWFEKVFIGAMSDRTYWNSAGVPSGNHTLGIAMIVVAAIVAACVVAAPLTRVPQFGSWAAALSLFLLGIVLYTPVRLAFNYLIAMRSGSGLALAGGLLAAAAMVAAALARRGLIDLSRSSLRQLIAIVGLGLALAGTWTDNFSGGGSFWVDRTLAGFVLILVVLGATLVGLSFFVRHRCLLAVVSGMGWVICGYFLYYLALAAPRFGELGPATWLGVGGGVLVGLSVLSMPSDWRRQRPFELTRVRAAAWLATGAGLALVLVSLWLDTERAVETEAGLTIHASYWDIQGDHSLGIVMLVLAASALVALAGAVLTRLSVLTAWTLAAALVLLGVALSLPALEAFNHLDALRSGAVLALVGSLLASAGAVAMALCEELFAEAQPKEAGTAPSSASAHAAGRRAAKGRIPGMSARKSSKKKKK